MVERGRVRGTGINKRGSMGKNMIKGVIRENRAVVCGDGKE